MKKVIFRTHETDETVTKALNRLKQPDMTVVTKSGGLSAIGTLKTGDKLIMLGHGSTKTLGGYSAAGLAKELKDAELKSGIHIELVACNCGTGGAPFALELKMELVGKAVLPASVVAGTGYMWVKSDGTPFSKTKGGTEIAEGTETVSTPWGSRKRNVSPSYRT